MMMMIMIRMTMIMMKLLMLMIRMIRMKLMIKLGKSNSRSLRSCMEGYGNVIIPSIPPSITGLMNQ